MMKRSKLSKALLFAFGGHMLWLLGLCMAAGAMLGGWLGSHSAIRFGARLIRPLLVVISLSLTARLLWGYFSGRDASLDRRSRSDWTRMFTNVHGHDGRLKVTKLNVQRGFYGEGASRDP